MRVVRASELPDSELMSIANNLVTAFGHLYPGWDTSSAAAELAEDVGSGLPLHLVGIENEQVIGIASIISTDEVTGWKDQGWWLANVLVLAGHRDQGVGHLLVANAIEIAKSSHARELHLVTDTAVDWYLRQGWKEAGLCDVHGHPMSLMQLALPE